MTIRFDHVGQCSGSATVMVEGYSPANGMAHGSLDVTLHVCADCLPAYRQQLDACGMTPYSRQSVTGRECGERATFADNKYTAQYPGRKPTE